MKSDIKVMQFCGKENLSTKLESYLNGENDWQEAILEKDIINIKYTSKSILLLHRSPSAKITF